MWFKQITCDSCFKLLEKKTSDNLYISIPYEDRKVLNSGMDFHEYEPYIDEYPLYFAGFNNVKPKGKLFIYKLVKQESHIKSPIVRTFCDNECAYTNAVEYKTILLYFDQKLNNTRAVCEDMIEINEIFSSSLYRGLNPRFVTPDYMTNFPEQDLSKYNSNNTGIPIFKIGSLELSQMQLTDADDLYNIYMEDGFMTFFDGFREESIFRKISEKT